MNKFILWICFVLLSQMSFGQHQSSRCLSDSVLEIYTNTADYLLHQQMIQKGKNSRSEQKSETIFTIPIVIHVLYKDAGENISLNQIQSQIEVLNEDYRLLNADTTNVEAGFSKADVAIEFCLATRDPNGNPTDGIIRTQTSTDNIGLTNKYYQESPAWNRDLYLNIWVCDLGPNVAGFAFPPGSPADRDGVVIHYTNFGRVGNVQNNYDKGRTATHEVGHWLNLLHPWGSNESCSNDDGIADTPNQGVIYELCPTVPQSSCGSKDMLSNFMGYVFDRCMGNFTEGQKEAMRQAIVSSRTSLILSKGCVPVGINDLEKAQDIQIFPNPTKNKVSIQFDPSIEAIDFNISVFNQIGELVQTEPIISSNTIELDLGRLEKGIYFIQFSSEKINLSKKIVVL